MDIDRNALDVLVNRFRERGLADRIEVIHTSMLEMKFPSNSFDIVWSEGAMVYIGFERGLREWRPLLAPEGYLVIHDAMTDLEKKKELIQKCGYTLLEHFELAPDIWWSDYYTPLKMQIQKLQEIDTLDKKVIEEIRRAEQEISEFDRACDRYGSVFFILAGG